LKPPSTKSSNDWGHMNNKETRKWERILKLKTTTKTRNQQQQQQQKRIKLNEQQIKIKWNNNNASPCHTRLRAMLRAQRSHHCQTADDANHPRLLARTV
jgi:hypothetical protein